MVKMMGEILKIHRFKKTIFLSFVYIKLINISTETWNNAGVDVITIHYRGENKSVSWLRIKDKERELDAKSICD